MSNKEALRNYRQSMLSSGIDATFEVPIRFTKSFIGEYVNPAGEKRAGKIIEGIASTEDKDQQGEIVMQDKMDCSYLLEKGYLNWNHSHAPEDQVGKPLEVVKVEGGPTTPGGRPATFFRAVLFDNVPRADAVWTLSKALESAHGVGNDRALGFSVEGGVRMRQGHVLVETIVRHMAVTHEPVNAQSSARCVMAKSQGFQVHRSVMLDTLDDNVPHFIFKSFGHLVQSLRPKVLKAADTGSMKPALLENLSMIGNKDGSPEEILRKLYDMCKGGRNCHDGVLFAKGRYGALEHLIHCVGMKPSAAADALAVVIKSLD
jgi:hypothetical protein